MSFKPQSVLQGVAGAAMLLAIVAGAQTPAAPAPTTPPDATAPAAAAAAAPAPTWSVGTIDFSGYIDGYVNYNANRPGQNAANPYDGAGGQTNQLYNFDDQADQFSLEAAKLTLNHDPDPIGAHIDLLFGRTDTFLHNLNGNFNDWLTANYIEQAYVSIKPPKAKGFELDAGQFTTSAGQEVIETMSNWSYSHGILFGYAIPYYHFGLRTSMPATKTWTIGAQLVNGWNNTTDNNGGVTVGLTSSVVKPKYTWNFNYYVGPENYDTEKGYRNLIDTTLLMTPNAKFNYYINYDYGQNHYSYADGAKTPLAIHSPHWDGVAISAHEQTTANSAIIGRYEYFFDNQGYATGTRGIVREFTGTYEYKWPAGLLLRAEIRHDWASDQKGVHFFDKGDSKYVDAQTTATIGLIAFFGPKR